MPTQTPEKRKLYQSTPRRLLLGVLLGVLGFVILSGVNPRPAVAATNGTINFQAKLMTAAGAIAADGYYNVQFNLYTVLSGGTTAWTETRDYNSNSPDNRVRVVNGYLTVNLGSVNAFPGTINWDQNLYLGMTVRGTGTCSFAGCTPADSEMSPRLALTATPYAFAAGKLSVLNGSNTSTLTIQGSASNVQNFVIPDQGAAGTYNLLTSTGAATSFIQLQSSTPGAAQTGNFNITGTGIASNIQAPLFQTADVSGVTTNSSAITFRSGNSSTSGNSGTVTIASGSATSGNSGSISIDSGTASGTTGNVNIGTVNATAINIGSGTNTINANSSVTVAAGKTVNITGGNTASRPGSPTEGMVYYDTTTKQLIVYSNGKWQADRNSSTKIVAASNASQAEKDGADYVATGTADQTIINTALTAAAGGKVYLTEGTFTTTDVISIPNDTTLAGAGRGTLIQFANIAGQTKNMITNTDTSTGVGVTVRDLQLDGLKATNTTGTQNGVYFNGMGGGAGSTAKQGATVTNIWANNFNSYGIELLNGANGYVSNSTAQGNGGVGFYISGNNRSTVTGNIAQGNTGFGINLSGLLYSVVSSNVISGNAGGGIDVSGSNNVVNGNSIRDNGGSSAFDSIRVPFSSSNNTISNNLITDTAGTGYAIDITNSGATSNYLNGNTFSGTGATTINDLGTGTIYGGQLDSSGAYLVQPSAAITLNAAGASSFTTTSGGLTIDTTSTAGQTIAIGNGAITHTIAIGTGAAVQGITIGSTNSTSSTLIQAGTGNLQLQTQGGTLGIGNNAVAQSLVIGNSTGATSVAIAAGTGGINIGTSGTANTIQIGNTSGAVTQTINIGNNATASSTTNVVVGSTIAGTTTLQSNGGVNVSSALNANAGLTVSNGGNFAVQKTSADFSTVGSTTDAAFGNGGYVRLTGASAQTINGIAGGANGRVLVVVNAASQVAIIKNASGGAGNQVVTGTGADINLGVGASLSLIYDSGSTVWRVTGQAASGTYINTIGAISATSNANGATITGSTLNLTAADNVNGGVVTNTIQSFLGLKTFTSGIASSGGAFALQGNAASSLTTTAGGLTIDTTTAAGQTIAIGDSAISHTIQIGTGAAVQTITLGSTNSTSSTLIQAGTGNLQLQTQGGTLGIGNNAVAQTVNIGNTTGATGVSIQAGTAGITLGTSGTTTTVGGGTIFTPSTGYSSGSSSTITASLLTNGTAVPLTATAPGLTFTMPTAGIGSAGRIVYVSNAGANNVLLVIGSGTVNLTTTSAATLYWNGTAWLSAGLDAGVTSIGTFGGSITNGLSISSNVLTLGAADATNPGGVSTGAQNLGGVKTFNDGVTVGNAAGSGALVNNGTTINTVSAQSYGTSSSITNINAYTAFAITATAGSLTITIPSPSPTTAGKMIYVSNAGATNAFTMLSATMNPGVTATLFWNGTAWTFAGADANSIINQAATPGVAQAANFNINGTGIAGNFQVTAGGTVDTATAGVLNVGTVNTTTLTLGKANNTATNLYGGPITITANGGSTWSTTSGNLTLQSAATLTLKAGGGSGGVGQIDVGTDAATINIGNNSNNTRTIAIGNTGGNAVQTVTLGNAGAGASTTTIQGGNGATAINVVTGNNGTNAGTINIGNSAGAFTQTLNIGTNATASSTTNINIGSTVAGSTILQSAGGVTVSKTLNVGASAGNGAFVNNGSTVNTSLGISNAVGAFGANTATVDIYSSFAVNSTAASQVFTVPTPTLNTTYGRLIYVTNIGTNTFSFANTYLTATLKQGATATLIWANVNGTPNWTYAGSDAGGVFNQTAQQTGANFNIDGTGIAATLQAATFDTASAVALNLAQTNASSINIGKTTTTATIYGSTTLGQAAGTGILINNGATRNTMTTQSTGVNVSIANVDAYTSFLLTATTTGITYTLPNPSPTTAGKLIYVSNASSGSNAFNLAPTSGTATQLSTGTTATMLWNGTAWTYAGTDTSSLQNDYTNSVASNTTPEIILDSTRAGLDIQDATGQLGNTVPLLAVHGAATATTLGTTLFSVTNNADKPLVGIGINVATRALDVAVNNTSTTQPQVLIEQANATGDAGIEFKNTATGTSFFIGQDTSNGSAFSINSANASATSPTTISFVQAPTPAFGSGNSTTIALAFGAGNTVGNTIVAVATFDISNTTTVTCTDTRGNAYTTVITKLEPTNNDAIAVCVATNIAAGANTVTATFGGIGAPTRGLAIHEYSGVRSVGPVDVMASNVGTTSVGTNTLTSTTNTTSQNGDLIFGALYDTGTGGTLLTAGTVGPFSSRTNANNILTEDKGLASAGSVDASFGTNTAGHAYAAVMVTLKAVTTQGDNFTGSIFSLSQAGAATFKNFANHTNAFQIQNAAATTNILNVDTINNRVGINLASGATATGDLSFGVGDRTINILTQTATNTAGNILNINSGAGNGTGAGGAVNIQGGAGGATSGAGGAVNIKGGNATGTNSAGGNVVLQVGASTGTGAQGAVQIQNTVGASIFTADPSNTANGLNLATNGGVESGLTNWTLFGTSTVTQDTTANEYASGTASAKAAVTAANSGAKYAITLVSGTTYNMNFSIKSSSGTPTLSAFYSTNGTSSAAACTAGSYDSANIATKFVKYTCAFTATSSSAAFVVIDQTDATSRSLFIDNLSVVATNSAGTQNTGVIKIGGGNSQGLTLFQLDTNAGTPFTGANASLAGAMYFDTTAGKMQCYDGTVWGACGAAPNSIITLSPEFAGAVLNGTGIGTLTSDFCSDFLDINDAAHGTSICGTNETYNFYRWTSPQATPQTYSVYITYQLPGTFKNFVSGQTTMLGRTDSANSTVAYSVYKNVTGTGLSLCSASKTVSTGVQSSWQTATPTTDLSTCSFAANNSIVVKVDVTASSNANAYLGTLNFQFSNQ